jgi:hypothetical protein
MVSFIGACARRGGFGSSIVNTIKAFGAMIVLK